MSLILARLFIAPQQSAYFVSSECLTSRWRLSDSLMLAVPPITYQLDRGYPGDLRSRLLPQYHSLKNSVIVAAAKEFILKVVCQESSQNDGHRRHDFQLKMHQKAFSGRAPPGPAGGA